mgnify:FL=1
MQGWAFFMTNLLPCLVGAAYDLGNNERGERAPLISIADFVRQHMDSNTSTLTDDSAPRYFFDNRVQINEANAKSFMPSEAPQLSNLIQCIPFELQEYFGLPCPGT